MMRITETVKHLIIINILMWIATLTIGASENLFNNLFALHFPKNDLFQPWQILTHMFMHASYVPTPGGGSTVYFQHILFNMFALWMFGGPVEQAFGKRKFIFFYISAGLGAALIALGVDYAQYQIGMSELTASGISVENIEQAVRELKPGYGFTDGNMAKVANSYRTTMVGASGAIMGVLVAFGMLYPESRLMLIFFPVPIKAKYFIPAIIGLDLFSALTGYSIFSPSNTAYIAHLGGAFFGFVMMWYWKRNQFNKNRWD
ncbi:rhomboid family intramembrane serine protease [Leptobacterium flavescens]|uniref:Rhomboid family intramembrane serine protease n=1 Tax=Leptobacterium flavescens TaxID=472055 RepID=A0A6P0UFT3_9FLAO|nr:rhomboid family intramembrane serine protease [Leptobacterium flavescens]NER12141.1 rhomboid family intramembrane serine protease [Leptobacterium flavescens]